ncbi:MAG: glycosyltransferase family 2 protein [Anaerolineae bacterium]|nr:glycosyltransferase family 2 protein [Anaerolineae bacterium]
MAERVSVIIPNWNGAAHLPACLDALRAQTYADYRTIVVDNGSTDDSRALLERAYPWVDVIALPQNLGFAGGCNAGFGAAESPVLVVLNNDTQVEPTWLEALLAAIDAHPDAGMVTPKVRLWDDRQRLHTTGDLLRANGIPDTRGVWEIDEGQYDQERYVFGASGVAPAYRREMLDEIGAFDARFGSYCEDVDLSWRAQLAGYRCAYAPDAVLYHRVSATGKGVLRSYRVGRNTIWTLYKNLTPQLWRRHRGAILAAQWARFADALREWRGAEARATMRGQLAGLIGLPSLRADRQRVQALRRVDEDYLESLLTPLPR